jgi:hypothetical protein
VSADRFPLLASMLAQKDDPAAPKRQAWREPVAPKLGLPYAPPSLTTRKSDAPDTARPPRAYFKPLALPAVFGEAQREAVMHAARVTLNRGEAPDGCAVRRALARDTYREVFPKAPTEAQCYAMLEALAREGLLEAHGHQERFFSIPDPAHTPKPKRSP